MDPYQLLTERFTLDNKPLLLSAAVSFAIRYMQYYYAIRLAIREGKSPIPFWMHLFYLAHDSTWSYLLGGAASRFDEHWFLRGTSTALMLWSFLEIFCIQRCIWKDREATFAPLLGLNPSLGLIIEYTILMQLAMYSIVALLIFFIGEGCMMQWFCYSISNNINGGVLFALNGLLEVYSDNTTDDVTIEIGLDKQWVNVYTALQPYGLYATRGRMKAIEVPGLLLIGGFHCFNNKYGMTLDQLVSYNFVLSNGTQVVANVTSNPELLWALKAE
ncbi:ABC superfamily atp binding cassette transporter permease protein [Seiridium cupressi]